MRYFFHIRDGRDLPDDEGMNFNTLQDALRQAIESAGALIKDSADHLWPGEEWSMTVTDAAGLVLCALQFTSTLAPAGVGLLVQRQY
ncbi:DUF6894 family protein [Sphingomonas sp.]|uniref:DUF6894 family protein n=1 Tax=Sphingomonas sp. TaxID=28214 RepID=UPI0028B1BB60|nr:hypothetical protein [Sphingomonas sp.]